MATRRSGKKNGKLKKFLLIASGLVVIFIAIVYLASSTYLTKNYITAKVEESINCRMEIGEVNLSLFSPTAKLRLKNIKLAQRDSFANDKTPHDDRPLLTNSDVSVSSVDVDISLFSILFRTLDVKEFKIDGFKAKATLKKDGSNTLESLFASADKEKREKDKKDKKKKRETFNVFDQSSLATNLRLFEFTNAEFDITIEATQLQILSTGVEIKLVDELYIDEKNLDETAVANIEFKADIDFQSSDGTEQYGEVSLAGGVEGMLFDAVSGDLDPNLNLVLEIGKGSHLKNVPAISRINEEVGNIKGPEVITKFITKQINKRIPKTYPFKEGMVFKGNFYRNVFKVEEPLSIGVGEWSLSLEKDSYINTGDSTHVFDYKFIAGSTFSGLAGKGADAVTGLLSKHLKIDDLGSSSSSFMKDGRVVLDLQTTGEFSSPSVELKTKFPAAGKIGDGLKKSLLDLF